MTIVRCMTPRPQPPVMRRREPWATLCVFSQGDCQHCRWLARSVPFPLAFENGCLRGARFYDYRAAESVSIAESGRFMT